MISLLRLDYYSSTDEPGLPNVRSLNGGECTWGGGEREKRAEREERAESEQIEIDR